jgi:hypothetical protein
MVVTQAITADTVKECADQFFDHVEITPTHVYIYFPEITVTNEYDLSIDIKGLVVRFNYLIQRDNTILVSNISGMRTEFNLIQFLGKYSHSHLPKHINDDFNIFCLGSSTPIRRMTENAVTDLDMLFATINAYVHNESVAGVPHIKMDTVMDLGSVVSKITSGNHPKVKHIVKFAKALLDDGSLQYQYVDEGILPKIKIRSGNDELLNEMLISAGLGSDLSQMTMLDIIRLVKDDVEEEDGEYYLPLEQPLQIGDLSFDRRIIVPTEEEIQFIESTTVGAGSVQLSKTYRQIEILLNKYLNV